MFYGAGVKSYKQLVREARGNGSTGHGFGEKEAYGYDEQWCPTVTPSCTGDFLRSPWLPQTLSGFRLLQRTELVIVSRQFRRALDCSLPNSRTVGAQDVAV